MSYYADLLLGGSCLSPGGGRIPLYIPSHYGYVVLTGVASSFLLIWKGINVGKIRKQYKINYPTMYKEDGTTEGNLFNCYQRAHQNTLENYPTFLSLLFLGGLEMPVFAAIGGTVWIAGRVSYALGYYTGDPKKRMQGAYGYLGLLMLLGASLKFGYRLITY